MVVKSWVALIDRLSLRLSQIVSWFGLVMVLLTLAVVVLRYGFDLGWVAMQETVMYLHACVFMLGASYTFSVDKHVRVDVFYSKMSANRQHWVNLCGGIFLLIPVCLFIFIASWEYVIAAWQTMERSNEAGGLPLVYALKTLILLFSGLMLLQGLADVLRHAIAISQREAR